MMIYATDFIAPPLHSSFLTFSIHGFVISNTPSRSAIFLDRQAMRKGALNPRPRQHYWLRWRGKHASNSA